MTNLDHSSCLLMYSPVRVANSSLICGLKSIFHGFVGFFFLHINEYLVLRRIEGIRKIFNPRGVYYKEFSPIRRIKHKKTFFSLRANMLTLWKKIFIFERGDGE